jgi:hypothetical protein
VFRRRFGKAGLATSSGSPAATRPRRLSCAKRIVFSVITLLLIVGLLEAGGYFLLWLANGEPFSPSAMQSLRDGRMSKLESQNASRYAQVHPFVGYVEDPRTSLGIQTLGAGTLVPISEYGYFDDKPPIQQRGPDRVVIGITGGSVACYFAINGTKRLAEELTTDKRFAGKKLVFVNLGLGAYKQPQQLMTVAYLLSLGGEFDFILNIDGFNEVAVDSLVSEWDEIFPAYPGSWRSRTAQSDTILGLGRSKMLMIDADRGELAKSYSQSPWRYSSFCNLVWELRDRWLDHKAAHALDAYQRERTPEKGDPHIGPRRQFANRRERDEFLAEIWANSSVLLDRLCRGSGIRYYHFLQPNQYLAGSKPMLEEEKRTAIFEGHPYGEGVERGYPILIRLGERLRGQGVAYHDLTKIFAGHSEPIYIDNCCHYNQAGYNIMAESIAQAIRNDSTK